MSNHLTEYAHQCGLPTATVTERFRFYFRFELHLGGTYIGTYRTAAQCRAAVDAIAKLKLFPHEN